VILTAAACGMKYFADVLHRNRQTPNFAALQEVVAAVFFLVDAEHWCNIFELTLDLL
jgi:hypothetical protein